MTNNKDAYAELLSTIERHRVRPPATVHPRTIIPQWLYDQCLEEGYMPKSQLDELFVVYNTHI